MLEETKAKNLILREFWKNKFNIVDYVKMIVSPWHDVLVQCLNSAWKNLWPSIKQKVYNKESDDITETKILSLVDKLVLDIQVDDVVELIDDHQTWAYNRRVTRIRKN